MARSPPFSSVLPAAGALETSVGEREARGRRKTPAIRGEDLRAPLIGVSGPTGKSSKLFRKIHANMPYK
jgi:hypothetical protein